MTIDPKKLAEFAARPLMLEVWPSLLASRGKGVSGPATGPFIEALAREPWARRVPAEEVFAEFYEHAIAVGIGPSPLLRLRGGMPRRSGEWVVVYESWRDTIEALRLADESDGDVRKRFMRALNQLGLPVQLVGAALDMLELLMREHREAEQAEVNP